MFSLTHFRFQSGTTYSTHNYAQSDSMSEHLRLSALSQIFSVFEDKFTKTDCSFIREENTALEAYSAHASRYSQMRPFWEYIIYGQCKSESRLNAVLCA